MRYECPACGYIYDEDQEGVAWNSLLGDWVCPACGAEKEQFVEAAASDVAPLSTPADVSPAGVAPPVEDAPAVRSTAIEPTLEFIHSLARDGLSKTGHHGPLVAMGVPRPTLPQWDDIQILPAQLAEKPLAEDVEVKTELVLGPNAKKPLRCQIPIIVSDMSFGALSEEAKIALARGAELAGTGIASGEGGMLPEEQAANSLSLRVGIGEVRLLEDILQGSGISLQGRSRGEDRDRRPPAGQQGPGKDRRGPQVARGATGSLTAHVRRLDHARRFSPLRRSRA